VKVGKNASKCTMQFLNSVSWWALGRTLPEASVSKLSELIIELIGFARQGADGLNQRQKRITQIELECSELLDPATERTENSIAAVFQHLYDRGWINGSGEYRAQAWFPLGDGRVVRVMSGEEPDEPDLLTDVYDPRDTLWDVRKYKPRI
jgi:hypothetical protein